MLVLVMTLPTALMTVSTMVIMTLVRRSPSPPPITVTLLPRSPRQYNTRDRQLVLNRLPMLPLSGALYVTFNSVQIDFVYFIAWNGFHYGVAKSRQCSSKGGKRLYRQNCSGRVRSRQSVVACCHPAAAAVASELLSNPSSPPSQGLLSGTQQR